MNLVLVHGYLLQGTGSNIYVANVAKAWKEAGHSVTVICQDRKAGELNFTDEFYGPESALPVTPPPPGTVRVIVPYIENLLPVYIYDEYEGYTVKTIPEMTEEEIERHIEFTAKAVRHVAKTGADFFLANHALLSPVITKRGLEGSDIPYSVKIHGSAMEFVAAKYPKFKRYAFEGFSNAKKIIAGTTHIKKRILEVFGSEGGNSDIENKIKIVPPGMDENVFRPAVNFKENEETFLKLLKERITDDPSGRNANKIPLQLVDSEASPSEIHKKLLEVGKSYNQRRVDSDLLERWSPLKEDEPIIIYFGKFLDTKGVGELMLLTPAILERVPKARFFFVGFGSYREHLEQLLFALKRGDYFLAEKVAGAGDFVKEKRVLKQFRKLTVEESNRILITGILDHQLLSQLLPLASVSLMPSTFPEAFGMVAVESMAAGVFPLTNYHSGMMDVTDTLVASIPQTSELVCRNKEIFFDKLPDKISAILKFLYPHGFENGVYRKEFGGRLREFAVNNYSWQKIATSLIDVV